jgi:hypothetical protein
MFHENGNPKTFSSLEKNTESINNPYNEKDWRARGSSCECGNER